MTGSRTATAFALTLGLFVTSALPAAAQACLEHLSCQLYGACHLPCLDALTGTATEETPPQAVAIAPATDATTPPPKAPTPVASAGPARRVVPHRNPRPVVLRIIVRTETTSLDQLKDRPVSVGHGANSEQVAHAAFARLGIPVQATSLQIDNALDGLASGDLAAVVVLDPREAATLHRWKTAGLHDLSVPPGVQPPTGMTSVSFTPDDLAPADRRRSVRAFAIDANRFSKAARQSLASNAR